MATTDGRGTVGLMRQTQRKLDMPDIMHGLEEEGKLTRLN